MALLLKCGAIFLHVPKTGGSWVTKVLEDQGLVRRRICHIHADMHQVLRYLKVTKTIHHELLNYAKAFLSVKIKQRIKGILQKNNQKSVWPGQSEQIDSTPFIFCFVRNPFDWYESIWRYMNKWNWPNLGNPYDVHDWHPKAMLNNLGDQSFNKFIGNIIDKRPGYITEMYGWYTMPGINFIGKQEDLAVDLIAVLTQLNVKFDEGLIRSSKPVNVSKTKDDKIIWDNALREDILKLEYVAMRRYGY